MMVDRNGNLRALIADDEAPARSRLASLLQQVPGWNIAGEAASGRAVMDFCEAECPDTVLLDIRMPGMDGIEVARHLACLPIPPAVIFTTAYDEYAVQAFDTHAVGYLLKPVRQDRLQRALAQAARLTRMQLAELARSAPELAARKHIPVTRLGQIRLVPVAEVQSFHADQKYVRMVRASGEDLIDESLKHLEQEFAAEFVRVHRNSLVRLSEIVSLERDPDGHACLQLRNQNERLPVSRRHLASLKQRLTEAALPCRF